MLRVHNPVLLNTSALYTFSYTFKYIQIQYIQYNSLYTFSYTVYRPITRAGCGGALGAGGVGPAGGPVRGGGGGGGVS